MGADEILNCVEKLEELSDKFLEYADLAGISVEQRKELLGISDKLFPETEKIRRLTFENNTEELNAFYSKFAPNTELDSEMKKLEMLDFKLGEDIPTTELAADIIEKGLKIAKNLAT